MSQHCREYRVRLTGFWCTYCGEPATTEDHFPPKSHSSGGFLIPACKECNCVLSTWWATDFESRCMLVKKRIARRCKTLIESPTWKQSELQELGDTLWSAVENWNQKQDRAKRRLAWNVEAYIASIDRNNVFALQDVDR